mmetsp:Transcript_58053/g.126233  ORF Transcript_58053/g.126233 Transcript_58053/m.126233 type:complete len:108 (-) Transcript_58053:39-362(-)
MGKNKTTIFDKREPPVNVTPPSQKKQAVKATPKAAPKATPKATPPSGKKTTPKRGAGGKKPTVQVPTEATVRRSTRLRPKAGDTDSKFSGSPRSNSAAFFEKELGSA